MKVFVDYGVPVINPAVSYCKGHFGGGKTRGHFSDSYDSSLSLTEAFLITSRITKIWAAMIEAQKCDGKARQEKQAYAEYAASLPRKG